MYVKRINDAAELATLRGAWNRLTGGVPFRSWQWLHSWWDHYSEGRELFVLAVYDTGGDLVGVAPWYLQRCGAWGKVIRFLGSGEVCSDYLTILTTSEHDVAVVKAIANWLAVENETGSADHSWDLLDLEGIDATDSVMAQLIEQLERADCSADLQPGMNCWWIDLPNSWEDYLARFSKSHRKQVRRVERRMLESETAALHTAANADELDRGMNILIDLHNRRRRSRNEAGCFASPTFVQFLRTAAERMLADGCLNLHWVEVEGQPVAAEFHLTGGGVTYAYQAGVDPEAMEMEPGRMINIATIKQAVEHGQHAFDFLRGDEPYKAHWRAEKRPTMNVRVTANRPLSQIRNGIWQAGATMKRWIKAGISRAGLH